jgi:glucose/mannose-6-phosphate isomerase
MATLNAKNIKAADPSAMFEKILELPGQLKRGWDIADASPVPIDFGGVRNIVFGGMGGSAIAGDVLKSVLGDSLKVPMLVNRGYTLPAFADASTLFIASSYSGNTEETLSAAEQAVGRGCIVLCVTSGGKIGEIAESRDLPLVRIPAGYPPRAALGFSLGVLLRIFSGFGVEAVSKEAFDRAVAFLSRESRKMADLKSGSNPAARLARNLKGRFPMISAPEGSLDSIGLRWKGQFNENSKIHAAFLAVPEMCHNEIVGWKRLAATRPYYGALAAVLLRSADEHPRVKLRMNVIRGLVEKNRGRAFEAVAKGSTSFERMLYLIHLGDVVSLYLAVLNDADPTEIENIIFLKKKLGQ